MKAIKTAITVLILSTITSVSFGQLKSASLTAAGLTCAMCSKAINTSLEAVPFVKAVKSDIKNSVFQIQFKEGSVISLDEIKKAVEDAGFSVARLKIDADFGETLIENDAHLKLDGMTYHFVNVKKQELQGQKQFTVVDKNYVGAKEFKKMAASTKMSCIHTGKMETCCTKDAKASKASRIYHLTL